MTKKNKLFEKIKNAPENVRFEDICALPKWPVLFSRKPAEVIELTGTQGLLNCLIFKMIKAKLNLTRSGSF